MWPAAHTISPQETHQGTIEAQCRGATLMVKTDFFSGVDEKLIRTLGDEGKRGENLNK